MKRLQIIKRFAKSLLIIALLGMLLLLCYQNWYIFTQNKWEVKNYTNQSLKGVVLPSFREKVAIKSLVENEFNIPHLYFDYNETWQSNVIGRACPQFNIVFIDKDLDGIEYATTLAHELAHCKYQSVNECYTEYMATITLIESDCEWLHQVGMYWANEIVRGVRAGDKYDCGWYLLEYFKGE